MLPQMPGGGKTFLLTSSKPRGIVPAMHPQGHFVFQRNHQIGPFPKLPPTELPKMVVYEAESHLVISGSAMVGGDGPSGSPLTNYLKVTASTEMYWHEYEP